MYFMDSYINPAEANRILMESERTVMQEKDEEKRKKLMEVYQVEKIGTQLMLQYGDSFRRLE